MPNLKLLLKLEISNMLWKMNDSKFRISKILFTIIPILFIVIATIILVIQKLDINLYPILHLICGIIWGLLIAENLVRRVVKEEFEKQREYNNTTISRLIELIGTDYEGDIDKMEEVQSLIKTITEFRQKN